MGSSENLETVRIPRWEEALRPAALATLSSETLTQFLKNRRWFGGKGHSPKAVRIRDVIPLFGESQHAVSRLEVAFENGRRALYQVPLAVRRGGAGDRDVPRAVLARIDSAGEGGVLFDAVEDPVFQERIAESFAAGARFDGQEASWEVAPVAGERPSLPSREGRLSGAEQSNTSIIFGRQAILKLYRRLEPGENPDVEIGEFLVTRTRFANVPRLLGTIRFHDRDGSVSVAGMLQELVRARGDGWSHALERFREEVLGGDRSPPSGRRSFARDGARLGEITRELHEALASDCDAPAFAPVPITEADLAGWRKKVGEQVERALDLLEGSAGRLPPELGRRAATCASRRDQALRRLDRLVESIGPAGGARIRHHGDLHLGQVLPTEEGDFVIIDFEGEPARPLEERRARHCALRDVAGMLRSFSYAAGAGARQLTNVVEPSLRREIEARSVRWEEEARTAYLNGYLAEGKKPLASFLPRSADGVRNLVAVFELEKLFYELEYELNNRPDWVGIPLSGVERVLVGT